MALFSTIYLTILLCLSLVPYTTLGLKSMLLLFGAVHVGSALLLLVVCWGELWASVSAWMKRQVSS